MPRPVPDEMERTCLVSRTVGDPAELIRFVLDPEGRVVPDLRRRLPGRGVWIRGERGLVETAVRKRLFARGFKSEAAADPALGALVDRLLEDAALGGLGLARKAGQVVTGFGKVADAIGRGEALAVLHAADAAPDGVRKVGQAIRRAARDGEDGTQAGPQPPVLDLFSAAQLGLALGGANVIHAALLPGGAAASFLSRVAMLARYRGPGAGTGPSTADEF